MIVVKDSYLAFNTQLAAKFALAYRDLNSSFFLHFHLEQSFFPDPSVLLFFIFFIFYCVCVCVFVCVFFCFVCCCFFVGFFWGGCCFVFKFLI